MKHIELNKDYNTINECVSDLKLTRRGFEKLVKNKVFLTLWVQVKANWTDNHDNLKTLNITP